jgi:DNA polymerase (family 10)
MENPNVDILFHPTARLINKRQPIDIDLDAMIQTAKRTGTVLEINSLPDRLDLRDDLIRKCLHENVKLVVDSDAHSTADFRYLELGIAQARRGWASSNQILNTLPLEEFLKRLKPK